MSSQFSGRLIIPSRLRPNRSGFDPVETAPVGEEERALIKAVNQSFAPALLNELNMHGVRTQMLDHALQHIDPLRHATQNITELDILFPELVIGNSASRLLDTALKLKAVNLLEPALDSGLSLIGLEYLDLSEFVANECVWRRALGGVWGKVCQFWLDIEHDLVDSDLLTVGSSIYHTAGATTMIKAYPKANGKDFTVEYDFSPLD